MGDDIFPEVSDGEFLPYDHGESEDHHKSHPDHSASRMVEGQGIVEDGVLYAAEVEQGMHAGTVEVETGMFDHSGLRETGCTCQSKNESMDWVEIESGTSATFRCLFNCNWPICFSPLRLAFQQKHNALLFL